MQNKEKFIERLHFLTFLIGILIYILLIISPSSLENQGFLAVIFLLVALFLRKKENDEFIKLVLIFATALISLRYFFWRTFNTINTDNILNFTFSILLYLAELYSLIIFLLGAFIALRLLERKPIFKVLKQREYLPTVDIFIPTYNEPVEIVKTTALAALSMNYPKDKFNVYILDDGGTKQKLNDPDDKKRLEAFKRAQALKDFVKQVNSNLYYITREKNEHAKSGNINNALKYTDGELILILDCDHVPAQDFLARVVGFFQKYPKLFLVQTPHSFYNPDPIEKNLQIFREVPNENDMFYKFIQKGLDFWSSAFFCGSAAVIRRKYLLEVGGIATATITEDAETALELHSRGYDSAYYARQMVYGLQPETFSAFITQRSRWAQGMVQIFLLKNPLFKKGLKWYQKLGYLNSSFFWFFGIARVIFLIAPLSYLFFGAQIYNASLNEVLVYAIPHFLMTVILSNYLYKKVRWNFFSEIYEALQSIFILPSIISVFLNPRKPTFKVTPKGENIEKDFITPFYKPIFILFNLTVLSFFFAVYRWINYPEEHGTILVVMGWQLFNLLVLSVGIISIREKAEKRKAHRIPANDDAVIYTDEATFSGKVKDISLTGIWIQTNQDLTNYLNKIRDNVIKFVVKDERGLSFSLKGKVVNANAQNVRMTFMHPEVLSEIENIENYKKLVEIVYAQSTKWRYFREDVPQTIIGSVLFLVRVVIKAFKDAYIMATKEFIFEIIISIRKLLNFLKKGVDRWVYSTKTKEA